MKHKFLLIARVLKQQLFLQNPKNKVLFLFILLTGLSVNGKPRKGVQKYRAAPHKHKKALLANPTLSYNSPNSFYKGTAITPLAPASTGVGTPGYNSPVFIGQNTLNYFQGLAVDVQGNVYVSNDQHGSYAIIKIPVGNGPISTVVSGLSGSGPLTVDASGNIFAVDDQTLIEIPAGTNNINTIGALGNFSSPSGIVVDASDDVFIGDRGSGTTIKEFVGGVGPFIQIGSGFDEPYGVALDLSGNVYVLDYGNKAIKMIPAGNGPVQTLASYYYPVAITRDNAGNFFVAGAGAAYNTVTEYPNGNFSNPVNFTTGTYNEQTLATDSHGNLYLSGKGGIEEIAEGSGNRTILAAGLNNCEQVAVDAAGNVFVADAYDQSVREIPAAGSTYPLTLTPNFDFGGPCGIAVDAADNVYVGDSGNGVIYKIAPGAATPTVIASGISNVLCIALDAKGNLFACNNSADLYKIAAGSNTVTVINSSFTQLQSVALDAEGNVYGYDYITNDVYKVPNGGAGTPVVLATGLNRGKYLAVDAANNVYITIEGNGSPSEIDQISAANGNVTPVATTLTQGVPTGVAIDGIGNLYAADYNLTNGFVVDKFTPSGGYYLNTTLPAGLIFDNTTGIISGTPTVLTPAANYTVTAYNSTGSTSATVNIAVLTNEANLSNLTISNDPLTLQPTFSGSTISYTASVGNGITSTTVTPTAAYPGATITVNNMPVTSGSLSQSLPLAVGPNTVTITVTAPDGVTKKTYTLIVTRAASANANLSSLKRSSGTLSPTFSAGTTSYTENVDNATATMSVTPTAADANATITVNGTTVASGTVSPVYNLTAGTGTVITTIVTAQNGTTKTYTLTVNRPLSDNDNLSDLQLSTGVLAPAFQPHTQLDSYSAKVGSSTTTIQVTPTAADASATITVNTISVPSGTARSISLSPGANPITVVVTAQNGATRTYTLTITRKNNDASLSDLQVSVGALSPPFQPHTQLSAYSAIEASGVSTINIAPTTTDPNATLTINSNTAASGQPTTIPVSAGSNPVTIVVTASDGSTKRTYNLTINVSSGDDDVYQPVSVEKPADSPTLNNDGITVHQAVSPNGDGINDFLQIDNISQYPDNKLMILNRNGQLVYEARGYDNNSKVFDGHSSKTGRMQLPGTYFYQLDYTANGITKHKTGFLVLKY